MTHNIMIQSSQNDKEFWNEFLNLYRSLPYLWWDNAEILAIENRENYRMKTAKAKEKLLLYVQQRVPTADLNFVQKKIHNFRCGFHREYRKKQKLESMGKVHRPLLWYYKKLLFLVDEENVMDLIDDNSVETSAKSMIDTYSPSASHQNTLTTTDIEESTQITVIKQEPIDENNIVPSPQEQIQDIENEINENHILVEITDQSTDDYVDINFEPEEIIKLETLQTQQQEQVPPLYTNKLNQNSTINSSADTVPSLKRNSQTLETIAEQNDEEDLKFESIKPKKVKLNDIYNLVDRAITQTELQSKEDMFDVIGRKIANDFREMTRSQRIFADKIINDVIYYAKSNRLRNSYTFNPS